MSSSQTLREKIIRGSFIIIVLGFLGSVLAYFVRISLSRNLSIEDYGLFYATLGFVNIATTYADLGFGYSVVYLLPKYLKRKEYSLAWNTFVHGQAVTLIISFVLAFVLILSAPYLADNYLKVKGSENLIYILSIYLILTNILNGIKQVYTGMQKEKYYSAIDVLKWFFILAFVTLIAQRNFSNVTSFGIAWVLGNILTAFLFVTLLFNRHSFFTNNRITWKKETLRQMSFLAFPALLETLVYSFTVTTDTLLLTLFRGVKEVGVYNIIYPIASIPIILFHPINAPLLPLVSHLMEGEEEKLKYLIERVLQLIPFIGLYFALFIMLFPSAITGLIFGSKWIGSVETPLSILSLGSVGILISFILGSITLGIGKVKEKLKVGIYTIVVGTILNILLIWQFGIMGAVVTASIIALILNVQFLKIINRQISFKIPYIFYLKLVMFSLFFYFMIRYLNINPHNWRDLGILGIIYTFIYFSFGFILKLYDGKLINMIFSK